MQSVCGVHQEASAEKRALFEDFGGKAGGQPLQELDPEADWFLAMVSLATDPTVEVTVTEEGQKTVHLETAYNGAPFTDPDFEGAMLVYRVFSARDPFPEKGQVEILHATNWNRIFRGPSNMSLRACLRAVRDLLNECGGCKGKVMEPPCNKCRYKAEAPESPRFSPRSPQELPKEITPPQLDLGKGKGKG